MLILRIWCRPSPCNKRTCPRRSSPTPLHCLSPSGSPGDCAKLGEKFHGNWTNVLILSWHHLKSCMKLSKLSMWPLPQGTAWWKLTKDYRQVGLPQNIRWLDIFSSLSTSKNTMVRYFPKLTHLEKMVGDNSWSTSTNNVKLLWPYMHGDDGREDHKDVHGHGRCHGGACGDTDDDWWQLRDCWCW